MPFAPELLARSVSPSLDLPWEEDAVALRRDFHEHPELGFQEVRSARIIAARLRALGLDEVREGIGRTGVVGILRGGAGAGPTVLVRADMDALPIEEQNGWEWKSKTSGTMHACAHDAHMAIGLSVARLLVEGKRELKGTVVFMFQPAEEGLGGAGEMIADGLLDDPRPDFALALHVWSTLPNGFIAVKSGPVMAATDAFRARIFGRGGHGASPHETVDPVVVASHLVLALQSIVSRNVKPIESAVVTVGKIASGTTFNVVPDEALLEGTTRAFSPQVRQQLEQRTRELVQTLPPVFGARGQFEWLEGFPAVVNNESVVERIRPAFERVAGQEKVVEFETTMGAEDMALVLERVPGCYFFVGGQSEEVGATWPHHHPKFNVHEDALFLGTRAMVEATKALLNS